VPFIIVAIIIDYMKIMANDKPGFANSAVVVLWNACSSMFDTVSFVSCLAPLLSL